jgi:protein-tyrosine phosphatase
MKRISILFVCMGNICRSPTAHGVFRRLVEEAGYGDVIHIESAGTHAYHVGEAPDRRTQQAARSRGVELADLRARQVEAADFDLFDYILAMDRDNYRILEALSPPHASRKLGMFLDFAPHLGVAEVPDPYYGGATGFEQVLDLVEAAAGGLLQTLRQRHLE